MHKMHSNKGPLPQFATKILAAARSDSREEVRGGGKNSSRDLTDTIPFLQVARVVRQVIAEA
jgi:hypothetical protein